MPIKEHFSFTKKIYMKKINLSSFKEDSIALEELMTVRGGSGSYPSHGTTKSQANSTCCCAKDPDQGSVDSDR